MHPKRSRCLWKLLQYAHHQLEKREEGRLSDATKKTILYKFGTIDARRSESSDNIPLRGVNYLEKNVHPVVIDNHKNNNNRTNFLCDAALDPSQADTSLHLPF
jgi:hypothetical protein